MAGDQSLCDPGSGHSVEQIDVNQGQIGVFTIGEIVGSTQSADRIAQKLVADHGTAVIFLTANPEQIPDGFAGALGAVSKPFDEHTIRAVVDFARQFIHHRTVGEPPRRFRLAPWLTTPPDDIAPH